MYERLKKWWWGGGYTAIMLMPSFIETGPLPTTYTHTHTHTRAFTGPVSLLFSDVHISLEFLFNKIAICHYTCNN